MNYKKIISCILAFFMFFTLTMNTKVVLAAGSDYIYIKNSDGTITITEYIGSGGDVNIPSQIDGMKVTSIGNDAFFLNDNLKSVTIPNSVTSIGFCAFDESSVTSIVIPDSVVSIGNLAFEKCCSLKSITIPKSVTSIGDKVFFCCTSLTQISVDVNNLNYISVNGVLFNKAATTLIQYPYGKRDVSTYQIPDSVTTIGDWSFFGCNILTSITIPNSVTTIDNGALSECIGLTSLTIPNSVTAIGDNAFYECWNLSNLTLSNSVKTIGDNAFYSCKKISAITLPSSLISIGACAFKQCASLTNISIPNSMKTIGVSAFEECSGLTDITIPNSVTMIGDSAFNNCSGLTNITIPNSVNTIGASSFGGCSSLANLVIHEGVTTIGDGAFGRCSCLTSITIPSSVTTIGFSAFKDCTSLKSAYFSGNAPSSFGKSPIYVSNDDPYSVFAGCSLDFKIYYKASNSGFGYPTWNGCNTAIYGGAPVLSEIDSNAFYIMVADAATREPLYGAAVEVGDKSIVTDNTGVAKFDNMTPGDYTVQVSKPGYCDDYSTGNSLNNGQVLFIFLKNSNDDGKPFITSVGLTNSYSTKYDLTSEAVSYKKLDDSITPSNNAYANISIKANWNKKTPKSYILMQKAKIILENNTGIFDNIPIGQKFEAGCPIYAYVQADDGTQSEPVETMLQVYDDSTGSEDEPLVEIGKSMFTIPDSVPLLGGGQVKFDFGSIPLILEIKDNTFKAGFGDKLIESESQWDDFKKHFEELENEQKKGNALDSNSMHQIKSAVDIDEFVPKAEIGGYMEGTIDNGEFKVNSGSVLLNVGGEGGRGMQYLIPTPVCEIPVFIKLNYDIKADMLLKVNSYSPETKGINTDGYIEVEPKLSLSGGIGVIDTLNIHATGDGNLDIVSHPAYGSIKATAGYDFKIGATAFCFNYDKTLSQGTYVIYDNTAGIKGLTNPKPNTSDKSLYDQKKYKLMDRSYIKNPSIWEGSKNITTKSINYTNQELKNLQTNIFPNAQPKVAVLGDKKVMVWIADNPNRTSANRTMLVYSIYDKTADTWSTPKAVDDDGTADYYPDICSDGQNLYVAYQNSKSTFDDTATMEQVAKAGDISVSKFDAASGTFDKSVNLTNNDVVDTEPKIAMENGKAAVVWKSNPNDIFGLNNQNSIYYSEFDGSWSQPMSLIANQNAIPSLSADYIGNTLTTAFVSDSDNDLSTIDDREIYIVTPNQLPDKLTDNTTIDSNPVFAKFNGTKALYWYNDGNIYYISNLNSLSDLKSEPQKVLSEQNVSLTDDFKVLTNSSGKTAVIWTDAEDNTEEIYGSIYDNAKNEWSNDIKISNVGDKVKYPDGTFDDNGNLDIAFNKVSVVDATYQEQSDLCTLKVVPSYDAVVNNVYFDNSKIIPGSNLPLSIDVENKGQLSLGDLNVQVMDGSTIVDNMTVSSDIKPGETKTITANMTLPDTITKKTYTIKVAPALGEEYDTSNNTKDITIGYTDLALSLKKYNVDGKYFVAARVSNLSHVPTPATLEMRANTIDGEVLDTKTITDVVYGNDQIYTYSIDPKDITFDSDIKQYYFTLEASGEEESTIDNSGFIAINKPKQSASLPDNTIVFGEKAYNIRYLFTDSAKNDDVLKSYLNSTNASNIYFKVNDFWKCIESNVDVYKCMIPQTQYTADGKTFTTFDAGDGE